VLEFIIQSSSPSLPNFSCLKCIDAGTGAGVLDKRGLGFIVRTRCELPSYANMIFQIFKFLRLA
jgi:hypothetical protein